MSKLSINEKDFKDFSEVCRYAELGASFHGSSECSLTCRNEKNIPEGHSWGKCNYKVCPIIKGV